MYLESCEFIYIYINNNFFFQNLKKIQKSSSNHITMKQIKNIKKI